MTSMSGSAVRVGERVADAMAAGVGIVALESTIFSSLGLPAPRNSEALRRCVAAVEAAGSVPAVCAVLDGEPWVGVEPGAVERVLAGTEKVAERDLAMAVATGLDIGVTTVSATLALAAAVGVEVFATGGIGGVHRGVEATGDISSDIGALARHPVSLVSAGAKAILDLPRTLEALETAGVPVVGFGTDEFPAFWSRSSGLTLRHRVDTVEGLAAAHMAHRRLGLAGGLLVANPVPVEDEIPAGEVEASIESAVAAATESRIGGHLLTPYLLERIATATAGRGVTTNLALAEANAAVAGGFAAAVTRNRGRPGAV